VPYLSLIDNVLLPCRFSAERRARALARSPTLDAAARRLLEHMALDVDDLASRPVTQLSTGQQQRVAAARALIGAPALVIADEPTSSLDADRRRSFLELLFREVEAAEATLLFVSHDATLEDRFDRAIALAAINRVPSAA
jgi:putative ABC transport system ATP-binding protein